MNETLTESIAIDEDFRNLVQPFSQETIQMIENNMINSGYHEKLFVWRGTLLQDFQIYELCQKYSISYETEQKSFISKSHAMSWVCSVQLTRPDLTNEYRKYLIGKKFLVEITVNQEEKKKHHEPGLSPSAQLKKEKYKIARMVAADLNIGGATVMKYGTFASAVDRIRSVQPELADRILSGSVKMSHESTVKLAEQSDETIMKIMETAKAEHMDHVIFSELTNQFQFRTVDSSPKKTVDENLPKIKQMPEPDPDSEINSLSLTIPSWVSSMENAHKRTDFSKTSAVARISLIKQFGILERTINVIQTEIEGLL